MASSINPNNIDTAYPVAGQDNDSQGFRDNFTNIKTNFEYAESEIEDLQSKVILKSALLGSTLDNDMSGAVLESPTLKNVRESTVALGTTSGNESVTIDVSAGPYQTVTTDGAGGVVSLGFSNWPTSGHCKVRLAVTVGGTSDTIVFPAAVNRGLNTIQGISGQTVSFTQTGTYEFEFNTSNGGSDIAVRDLNRIPLFNSVEETPVGDSTVNEADLTYLGSWATTIAGPGDIDLTDGTEGQLKTFALSVDGGDLTINVDSAAWNGGASGTITLNDAGDGCILQFMNSRWFVLGNNGCTLA
jgi:hypothetical protein